MLGLGPGWRGGAGIVWAGGKHGASIMGDGQQASQRGTTGAAPTLARLPSPWSACSGSAAPGRPSASAP